ncbi:MAG: hypothetical protein WDA16_12105 [Candidatus Thermoplasmatota archaeon]
MSGRKPLSVVAMETLVLSIVGIGSIIGLLTSKLSSDAVTAVWGLILGYAFKNGYQYVNRKGEVIGGGPSVEPAPSVRP